MQQECLPLDLVAPAAPCPIAPGPAQYCASMALELPDVGSGQAQAGAEPSVPVPGIEQGRSTRSLETD